MSAALRIPRSFRLALAAKGGLLGALALLFALLAFAMISGSNINAPARVALTPLFGFLAWFLGRAASLALADAVLGEAVTEAGAVALASRRAGWSLQTADSRFVEYVLWNPWGPLQPGHSYAVTYGRYSRVLVSEPVPES